MVVLSSDKRLSGLVDNTSTMSNTAVRDNGVFEVQVDFTIFDHMVEETENVPGVHLTGMYRHRAWNVQWPVYSDAVFHCCGPRFGKRAVASHFTGYVNYH